MVFRAQKTIFVIGARRKIILVLKFLRFSFTPLFSGICYHEDMFYVYVLKSQKHLRLYYGFSTNIPERIKEHNSGNNQSTKSGIPWKLIYYEAYLSKEDAILRERQLKNYGSAFGFLRKRIKYSINKV